MNRAWWIYVLGVIATLLSFPYPPNFLALLTSEVVVILMIWAGLWFGAKHALGSRIPPAKRAALSLVIGAVSGAIVLALLPLAGLQSRIIKEASIPLWKWLIIAFDSSILEEIIFRLFILSFVVWLLARFMRREPAVWIAIVVAALLFGAAHLNRWLDSGPAVIVAVILVNGAIAIAFGWIYVKWGIEAAMLSHFAGDVVVHILGPHVFI
jgi:membrane protease YdiL (CAAX protease family)